MIEMSNFYFCKFGQVEDIEVIIYPGNMSIEPVLFIMDGKKKVEITLSSNIYENDLGEFMLHTGLSGEYRDAANKVMRELAAEVVDLEHFIKYILKPAYKEKLMSIIEEEEKSGRYYKL
ncbi:hypothetical protein WKU33_16940 [Oceanobacillus sp. HCA-5259]